VIRVHSADGDRYCGEGCRSGFDWRRAPEVPVGDRGITATGSPRFSAAGAALGVDEQPDSAPLSSVAQDWLGGLLSSVAQDWLSGLLSTQR